MMLILVLLIYPYTAAIKRGCESSACHKNVKKKLRDQTVFVLFITVL